MRGLLLAILIISAFTGRGGGLGIGLDGHSGHSGRLPAGTDTAIHLILELEKPCPAFSLDPAPLRYNKDFSFSFTFDDGLVSAYLVAFPFFNGGKVSSSYTDQWGHDQGGDGLNYPGLFYTDGCGNRKPFQAALAINAASIAGREEGDITVGGTGPLSGKDSSGHPGNLSWGQLSIMYKAGWDVFNHGYSHATGAGVDAPTEVRKNNESVFQHFGCIMNQFVVPGGKEDQISQEPYTRAAFEQGMLAVHCGNFKEDWDLPVLPANGNPSAGGGESDSIRAGRKFLSSKWLNGKHDTAFFKDLPGRLKGGKKTWINAFTHSVGNEDLWSISLTFKDFKSFFEELAARYGEKGKDNIWMASYQAVQEYQLIRRTLVCAVKKEGKKIILSFDPGCLPIGLRHKALSFVWKAGVQVRKVSCDGCVVESFSDPSKFPRGTETKKGSQVINILIK